MKIDYKVPFYANTPDDTRCVQACFKMILKYFQPEKDYSWEELDIATAKPKDFGTHYVAGSLWMKQNGYDVYILDSEDHKAFIEKKGEYLEKRYGKEFADVIVQNTNMENEVEYAKELLNTNIHTKGLPNFDTIKDLLEKKYLLICIINHSMFFDNEDSYDPHVVVIKGITNDHVIMHDPGPPAAENLEMSFEKFDKAWSFPDTNMRNVLGFRLSE